MAEAPSLSPQQATRVELLSNFAQFAILHPMLSYCMSRTQAQQALHLASETYAENKVYTSTPTAGACEEFASRKPICETLTGDPSMVHRWRPNTINQDSSRTAMDVISSTIVMGNGNSTRIGKQCSWMGNTVEGQQRYTVTIIGVEVCWLHLQVWPINNREVYPL